VLRRGKDASGKEKEQRQAICMIRLPEKRKKKSRESFRRMSGGC